MSEGSDRTPIFTCEADFDKIWRRDDNVKSKCFSDVNDDILANSFVFKSFRNEYETDHLFTQKTLRQLKSGELNFDNLEPEQDKELPSTVPGYKIESFIPTNSILNRREMTHCFGMYKELCKNKTLSNSMLAIYNEYMPQIQKEQKHYQNVAKGAWLRINKERQNEIKPEVVNYTNRIWKERLERVSWYPKHYVKIADLSLSNAGENKPSEMTHMRLSKHVGFLPRYWIPNLKTNKLNVYKSLEGNNDELNNVSISNSYKTIHKRLHKLGYHPDVSKDKVAEGIAISNHAQIVMSASSFLHLIDNHPKHIGKSWNLPIVIKESSVGNDKRKIVYIDKALAKKSLTAVDRIKWFTKIHFKKSLKNYNVLSRNDTEEDPNPFDPITYDVTKLETFGNGVKNIYSDHTNKLLSSPTSDNELVIDANLSDQETLNIFDEDIGNDQETPNTPDRETPNIPDRETPNISDRETPNIFDSSENENEDNMDQQPPFSIESHLNKQKKHRLSEKITYNMWSLTSETSSMLLKSNLKNIDVLIRSKSGGKGRGKLDFYHLSPKLEYQTEFGAEIVTLSEALRDWGNVLIRPGFKLLRARFDALTGEVVMFEEKTHQDLSHEIKRLYCFNPHTRLNCIHMLLEKILEFEPGNYLLSHSVESETFVQLYKHEPSKPTFNLFLDYQKVNPEEISPPRAHWCPIDQYVLTPTFLHFRRIPATFHPKRTVPITSKLEVREVKEVKKQSLAKKRKKKAAAAKKKLEKQHMLKKTISDSDT